MPNRRTFAFLATLLATSSLALGANADSLATGAPTTTFNFADYVVGTSTISLSQLTDFRWVPDGRMILIRKTGQVVVRRTDGTLVSAGSFPVDSSSEKGLLGVEVHPLFATNNTLFFYYSRSGTAPSDVGTDLDRHRVVSITLKTDNTLDMTTEKILVRGLRGPANHDGGSLAIAGDGTHLFIGVGDTGCNSGVAPGGTITNYFGTCLTNGNGKILRVNFDGTIPTDNPLVGLTSVTACGSSCGTSVPGALAAPRTDIWSWGFRNPWRTWVDPVTGNLWVGDVGEVTYEEIAIVPKGKHMGWPWREGAHGYPVTECTKITPNVGNCVDPVYDCRHGAASGGVDGGCTSITGGAIIDACDWPTTFRGLYFFGDNANNALWTLQPNSTRDGIVAGSRKDFGSVTGGPVSIRPGPDGQLYVASLGGRIVRFTPKTPVSCGGDGGVDSGTDTGVVDSGTDTAVADTTVADTSGSDTSVGDTSGSDALDDAPVVDAPPRDDGTDTATGGDTATSPPDSSSSSDSTTDDTGAPTDAPTEDSGGCGCVTAGSDGTNGALGLVVVLSGLSLVVARRRRVLRR